MKYNVENITSEIKKVIVGKDDIIEKVLIAVLADGHVLLEDVPGVGKTTMALAFSKVMNLSYKRVQFTSDTMAGDIVGFSMYNKNTGELEFKEGAAFCNLLLADEINRTSPKTQAALLEAMEERRVTVDGVTYELPKPFICIATQNPIGSAGTHKLPDSQLDRFMMKLHMGYPSVAEQVTLVKQRQEENPLQRVECRLSMEELQELKDEVNHAYIDDAVIAYASELCDRTRNAEEVMQGVSPRALLALIQAAKAHAFLRGRDYVIPEDIRAMFCDVCAHRLILTGKARVHHVTEEDVLNRILGEVKAPSVVERNK
jgi:MoxR-like ATPase